MSDLETDIAIILAAHYATGGWAPRGGSFMAPRHLGRWGCGCGAGGQVQFGQRVVDKHRAHVAEILAATFGAVR